MGDHGQQAHREDDAPGDFGVDSGGDVHVRYALHGRALGEAGAYPLECLGVAPRVLLRVAAVVVVGVVVVAGEVEAAPRGACPVLLDQQVGSRTQVSLLWMWKRGQWNSCIFDCG